MIDEKIIEAQKPLKSLQTYFDLMVFNGSAFVFQTARAMGIFQALGPNGGSAPEIAERAKAQEKPVRLVLNCLVGMGLVDLNEDVFHPTQLLQMLAGPYNQLGKEYWDHLPAFIKTGRPIAKMDNPEQSEKEYLRQVESLDWMMKPSAVAASQLLGVGTGLKSLNILDLGAGSGVWSLQMLSDDLTSRATLNDWPAICDFARGNAQARKVADRTRVLPGSYHDLDFGDAQYDLAILGNIAHIETEKSLGLLLQKVSRALKPGGTIAIMDVFPALEQGKLSVPLYALGLALRTESGQLHSFASLKNLCLANRFIDVKFSPLDVTPHTMGMLVARRFEN